MFMTPWNNENKSKCVDKQMIQAPAHSFVGVPLHYTSPDLSNPHLQKKKKMHLVVKRAKGASAKGNTKAITGDQVYAVWEH